MQSALPKVVHVVVAGEIGGAERFLAGLASRPELSGADHVLALMTPNPELRSFFRDAGLRIHDRGFVRENPAAYLWRSYGPADVGWLGRVIAEENAGLLHAHTYGSHVLAARAGWRHGLPVVRTEHGVRHYRDLSCALNRQWALRHTDRIVAVSEYVARTVAAVAPPARERIRVIPNGADLAFFAPAPPRPSGPFTFAMIGRLDPVKRVHLAIEAAARTPSVRLDIAGGGRERGRLERLARDPRIGERVRFLGHLSDPRPAVAACDAVVNCTLNEGLGLAVIEAAAMGRPAVAFDGGGIPEIVEDRRTGWLARQETAGALAAALAEAASDRARAAAYGIAARRRAETKFGIETMCRAYAAVYAELVRQ